MLSSTTMALSSRISSLACLRGNVALRGNVVPALRSLTTISMANSPSSEPKPVDDPSTSPRPHHVVMSLAGRDRTGIVKTFTKAVVEHKANVQESKMAILGGDFAMIVFITMENAGDADNLAKYLQKELPDYLVTTRNTTPPPENKGEAQGLWSLLVEAPDQPGIVAALSQALATHGANVHQLDTELTTAPFAGYTTFKIMGKVALSEDHLDEISTALNKLEDSFGASIILNQIEA